MNRRGFFGTIGKVAAGFMILPGAGRVWKAVSEVRPVRYKWAPNPNWFDAPYEIWIMDKNGVPMDIPFPKRFLDPNMKHEVQPFISVVDPTSRKAIEGLFDGIPPFNADDLRNPKSSMKINWES